MKIHIYQTDNTNVMFNPFEKVRQNENRLGEDILSGYRLVYIMNTENSEIDLEGLFALFNQDERPDGFTGRSMSVSDIIIVSDDNKHSFQASGYYVDPLGFKELSVEDIHLLLSPPTRDHELLNMVIENLLVGESPLMVIKYLLCLGFSVEDILRFNFSKEDVAEAEKDFEDGYDCPCRTFF